MVTGIRRSLVEETDRLAIQSHKLALEPNVSDPGDIFLATTPVIFKEEGYRGGGIPVGAI